MNSIVEECAKVWDRRAMEAELTQASAKLVEQNAEIERLRACAEHKAMWSTGLANQAAAKITSLKAENERLKKVVSAADALRSAIRTHSLKRTEIYKEVMFFDATRAVLATLDEPVAFTQEKQG